MKIPHFARRKFPTPEPYKTAKELDAARSCSRVDTSPAFLFVPAIGTLLTDDDRRSCGGVVIILAATRFVKRLTWFLFHFAVASC
jgi:hypothetical protein